MTYLKNSKITITQLLKNTFDLNFLELLHTKKAKMGQNRFFKTNNLMLKKKLRQPWKFYTTASAGGDGGDIKKVWA